MIDDTRLDNQLADFTDHLLAGDENAESDTEVRDLADVVRQMRTAIPPGSTADPAFRAQLAQRLQMEWNLQHQPKRAGWQNRRVLQLMAAGIAVAVLLIVLLSQGSNEGSEVQGTALGSLPWEWVVVLGIVGVGALVVWYRQRR